MRLHLWAAGALSCATVAAVATPGCYTAGGGTAPPPDQFYFPVGLAVSPGGHTLYAVNSDFDLQWSGGTLQSYDLDRLRQDAQALIAFNTNSLDATTAPLFKALVQNFVSAPSNGGPLPCTGNQIQPGPILGEDCSPPIKSEAYHWDTNVVGAFATDLQLARSTGGNRLFFPVRGTATLTWRDVDDDVGATCPPNTKDPLDCFGRRLQCKTDPSGRCQVGDDAYSPNNTRNVTMPGEPFGMAFTPDQSSVAITHQTTNNTSLLTTGFVGPDVPAVLPPVLPTMQFVLSGVPVGGNGIAAVPHDPFAVKRCGDLNVSWMDCTQPAFLETNRTTAELDLLRYYSDDSTDAKTNTGSSLRRPYLVRERVYSLTANSLGIDSRGIVIDPTPRYACDAKLGPNPTTDQLAACGKIPARVFFASRSPPSVVVGEIGELSSDGSYDPDALVITGNAPVDFGPAKVYLAPIIDQWGLYELRVFVVCFDAAEIFIYDPEDLAANGSNATPQGFIQTGPGTGPFAMAFDPMPLDCVAVADPKSPAWNAQPGDKAWPWRTSACPSTYRFGYVASFTQSFVKMIDLDASKPSAPFTFQQVVFTLGKPTLPKGQTPSKGTSLF
jgi:hypothetical protein